MRKNQEKKHKARSKIFREIKMYLDNIINSHKEKIHNEIRFIK